MVGSRRRGGQIRRRDFTRSSAVRRRVASHRRGTSARSDTVDRGVLMARKGQALQALAKPIDTIITGRADNVVPMPKRDDASPIVCCLQRHRPW